MEQKAAEEKAVEQTETTTVETTSSVATSGKDKKKRKRRKNKGGAATTNASPSLPDWNKIQEKRRKNAKAAAAQYISALEAKYPLKLQVSETRGRHFVTTRKIDAGEVVFNETPYALSPSNIGDYGSNVCSHCLSEITSKADPSLKCQTCPLFYCSQKCKETSQPLHDLECPIFTALKIYSEKSPIEGCNILLALRTLLRRQLELSASKKGRPQSPLYDLIISLDTHRKEQEEIPAHAQHIKHLAEASTFLLDLITKEERYKPLHNVPLEELVDLFLVMRANALPLRAASKNPASEGFGFGLFAGACLFNHSCIENVSKAYQTYGSGGEEGLVLYAVVDEIAPGTEVAFSYLEDPCQPTQMRQETLLKTKFFLCSCPRCLDPTECGLFLRGAVCLSCKGGKGKGKGKATTPTQNDTGYLVPVPLPASTLVSMQTLLEEQKQEIRQSADWQCSKCKKVEPATGSRAQDLYKIEQEVQNFVEQALYMLQISQLITPIVEDSGPEEFKRAIAMLEEVLKNQQDEWHPNHHILFLAKLNLVGCYLQPGISDVRRCLELSEEICNAVETIIPSYSVTKAELLGDRANILQKLAMSTKSAALQKRHLDKGREALALAVRNLKVSRGDNHYLTKEAETALSIYGRNKPVSQDV